MSRPFRRPDLPADLSSVAVIAGGAGLALVLTTAAFMTVSGPPEPVAGHNAVRVEFAPIAPARPIPMEPVHPRAGADRIYGRVVARDGAILEGYLRWDGREASWADLLPATASVHAALSGVRFGHLSRLEPRGGRGVRATLKGGDVAFLAGTPRDGVLHLSVETVGDVSHELAWTDVDKVDLLPEPVDRAPEAERLHGTVVTASGLAFTGYVLWNGTEGLLGDGVGDEFAAGGADVPFEDVVAVVRDRADRVLIYTLDGRTRGVALTPGARGPGALVVADPGLGTVTIPWASFRELRLHEPDATSGYDAFDGGRALEGVVVRRDGSRVAGWVTWDLDEDRTWQTLDGMDGDLMLRVELDRIARARPFRSGARLDLVDGRTYDLYGTNDVNWSNRGIRVRAPDGVHEVPWKELGEVRFGTGGG